MLILKNLSKILFVGRLIEKKGVEYLIKAIPYISAWNECKLIIVGKGFEEDKLKKLVIDLDLENNVKFIGKVSRNKITKYFKSSDIFILPSIVDSKGEVETLGVVLIEAMAMGIPVIGSDIGGIPDVIDDSINGFLVEPKSITDIADKVIKLLSDKKLRNKFIKNAKKKVKEKFDWNNIALDIENVINEVIKWYQ